MSSRATDIIPKKLEEVDCRPKYEAAFPDLRSAEFILSKRTGWAAGLCLFPNVHYW